VNDGVSLSIDTVCKAKEAFCSGTAASVAPVASVTYRGQQYLFNEGKVLMSFLLSASGALNSLARAWAVALGGGCDTVSLRYPCRDPDGHSA